MNQVLLELLKQRETLSGEEIGQRLKISRAAVWKQINRIKERNINIESVHGRGYRISSLPDSGIIPELVYLLLHQDSINIHHFLILPSTNTEAKKLALTVSDTSDFLVLCDEQTAGRGRRGRSWISNKGHDLTFTLGLNINNEIRNFFHYTIMMAVSVHKVLSNIYQGFSIKWPNDILWGDKKICGILSEMITEGNSITQVLIGVGININSKPVLDTAQSLYSIDHERQDINHILAMLINTMYEFLTEYNKGDFSGIFQLWKENLSWMGKKVRVTEGEKVIHGILKDVQEDGSLVLDCAGERCLIYSGDLDKSLRLS